MSVIVDTRTMMVMHVYTGEGPVTLEPYKSVEDNDFGMPEWDYD